MQPSKGVVKTNRLLGGIIGTIGAVFGMVVGVVAGVFGAHISFFSVMLGLALPVIALIRIITGIFHLRTGF